MPRFWAVLMLVAPRRLRHWIATSILGWDVHPTAWIGHSVIVVKHVSMGPESSIGPWNVIRGLDELRLGTGASIGSRNFILNHPPAENIFPAPGRRSELILGDHAMVTVGHEIDCTHRFELREHARLGGYRSQVLTHSVNLVRDIGEFGAVVLGERSAVMSGCILLCGTTVPPRSIVSAGSVVTTKLTEELTFYRGNPAEAVRRLPATLGYFRHGLTYGGHDS